MIDKSDYSWKILSTICIVTFVLLAGWVHADNENQNNNINISEPIWKDASNTSDKIVEASKYSSEFGVKLEEHTLDVLKWQLFASKAILFLVVVITISGVAFSAYQLNISLKCIRESKDTKKQETVANTNTSLNISKDKIEVVSPINGVIVLIISLAFLYLFLNLVYKININII